MISNHTGTVLRIFGIGVFLVVFWYTLITGVYFLACSVFGFEFGFGMSFMLFGMWIVLRALFPKNVFV